MIEGERRGGERTSYLPGGFFGSSDADAAEERRDEGFGTGVWIEKSMAGACFLVKRAFECGKGEWTRSGCGGVVAELVFCSGTWRAEVVPRAEE